jgi:hypothetical protein
MMGKSNEELEIHRLEQEELAEQARQTMDITMQLKKAFQAFYISLKPFLDDVIIPLVGKMAGLAEAMGKFFATKAGMITFFAIFVGLMVTGIALVTAFALATAAGAFASVVGAPAGAVALGLLAAAGVAMTVAGYSAAFTGAGVVGAGVGLASGHGQEEGDPRVAESGAGGYAAGGSVGRARPRRVVPGFADPGSVMEGAATPIEINEFDSERLIVPYGTYVANAQDVKRSNELAAEIITELQGLRTDLSKATSQPAQLVVGDDKFASTLVNKSGIGALT